ncbi:MAG: PH domain-containing protein [Bacteroides graminisolvens]|jgi:tetrahydromethanopterin S-methyltransferase subunit E|uniref:PH domain-containing protein n=1 Tax=Bacteroides graminisolvens TaxID=477666 RepID=UPI00280BADD7|nr:PH domain-containing protein [uncultured Bacteroides sp.]MCD8555411.1 PH domain-containing protein [Bacteroides graminisolvens]
MNRVFHARITWYHLLFLVLVSVCTVYLVWHKQALGALLFSLVLLVLIECVIHTTYTVTAEGLLVIAKGRFYKKRTIPIGEILSIERKRSMTVFNCSVTHFVLIRWGYDKYVALIPVKEKEFIQLIRERIVQS